MVCEQPEFSLLNHAAIRHYNMRYVTGHGHQRDANRHGLCIKIARFFSPIVQVTWVAWQLTCFS